jgi:sulfite oxidase
MKHTRRGFFAMVAGGLALAQDRASQDMIVRSARPEDLEMPLSGFADYITPAEHFFVRTHVYVPNVNINAWRLKVEGEVATPLTLTMDEIRKLPSTELVAVTECAGNGRGFFEPHVPGLQWTNGSVANARWRGARLADVLERAGMRSSAVAVLFDGADEPLGKMQDFRRSIAVKKALDPNTLLAFEMNGAAIPIKHGFPLRLIVPGWASNSWVKWVTSITVLDQEFDGFWMKNAYRKPDHPVMPMTSLTPEQMKPVTSLQVKSVIASPVEGPLVRFGTAVAVRGVAWSGDAGPVNSVEVSVDRGQTWKPAKLAAGQRTQFGWRQWEYAWTPPREEYYTILARARDEAGNTQPFAQGWNPSGYGWNVVQAVSVNVAAAAFVPLGIAGNTFHSGAEPSAAFNASCNACHGMDVIEQQQLNRAQWDREIRKMINWGAEIPAGEHDRFLDYLASNFPQLK